MFSVAIFGGNRVDGSMVDPGERVTTLALFGGVELDFASVPPPPAIDLLLIAIFGGITVKVHPDQAVRITGFSLFGGRSVDPRRQLTPPRSTDDEELDLPLEIAAYSLFGGVSVERKDKKAA